MKLLNLWKKKKVGIYNISYYSDYLNSIQNTSHSCASSIFLKAYGLVKYIKYSIWYNFNHTVSFQNLFISSCSSNYIFSSTLIKEFGNGIVLVYLNIIFFLLSVGWNLLFSHVFNYKLLINGNIGSRNKNFSGGS